ncbi:MAG: type II secretion system protein [Candidatus Omnitrophota bacterium]|nr:type II secretion system protein [Candidatus Omnitrophota bacterium]
MNNRGFILVASYMVVAVLIILATTFSARSIGEKRVADKERDTVQALWLAEAGVDRAIQELPNTPLSGTLGTGAYSTQTTALGSGKYLINSTGGVPLTTISPNNAIRKISAVVQQPLNPANPGNITSAITANGDVVLKGAAQINGTVDDNTVFNFTDIFGMPKDDLESRAAHHYTDPPSNVTPVDHVTWVDTDLSTEMRITTDGWTGSGILVVDGDMTITGGTFSGIIWVIGTLRVSGNPVINGAMYVESGATIDTIFTGTPIVNYDSNAINSAFGFLPSSLPPHILSWKED